MNTKYGLTTTEWQIMELMWSTDVPMTFREIMEVATTEWNKTWKVQTLKKMELLGADKVLPSCNVYYPLCTKEQHIHNWTKKLVERYFGNSFSRFVTAFIGDEKLSDEEKEELRRELNKLL